MSTDKWPDLQRVNINDEESTCRKCGQVLTELRSFIYAGETADAATSKDELCKCSKCGTLFVLHYDYFDKNGHVFDKIFSGDINSPESNWQDRLSEEQRQAISEHLKDCKICQERLEEEILTDAWLTSFINDLRRRVGKDRK